MIDNFQKQFSLAIKCWC